MFKRDIKKQLTKIYKEAATRRLQGIENGFRPNNEFMADIERHYAALLEAERFIAEYYS